jgi:hypothetical protein
MDEMYFFETSVGNYDPACCKNSAGQFFQYDKQKGLHSVGFIADCFNRISDNTLTWNRLFKALHKNRFTSTNIAQ